MLGYKLAGYFVYGFSFYRASKITLYAAICLDSSSFYVMISINLLVSPQSLAN